MKKMNLKKSEKSGNIDRDEEPTKDRNVNALTDAARISKPSNVSRDKDDDEVEDKISDDDGFDDLIKNIQKEKKTFQPENSKKLPPASVRPFSISSSSSSGEDDEYPHSIGLVKPSGFDDSEKAIIQSKVGKEEKRRMSFFQLKELEDSLNVELGRRIDLNQSVMREREGKEEDDDNVGNTDEGEDEVFHLTFDLSYGNFSFQSSINDVTQTPLRPSENKQRARSLHSTPLASIQAGRSSPPPPIDLSPEKENKPVFDLDSSMESPLPLRERLKRGLM